MNLDHLPYCSGVYEIKNLTNNKRYIGSSVVGIAKRVKCHIDLLVANQHSNRHLQSAWNKYGKESFVALVLRECEPHRCLFWEQKMIDFYKSYYKDNGYNSRPRAENNLGMEQSESARKAISAKGKLRYESNEEREKSRQTTKESWNNPTHRSNRINGLKKSYQDNPQYKVRQAAILARPDIQQKKAEALGTEKSRKKNSDNQKRVWSNPVHKEKMRTIHKKRSLKPEERKRLSKISKDKFKDPVQRKKMSDHLKRLWADPEYRERMLEARRKGNKPSKTKAGVA